MKIIVIILQIMMSPRFPCHNEVPYPLLPRTGSLDLLPDAGWREMHSGLGSFLGVAWVHFKGDTPYNWIILRGDCRKLTKAYVKKHGRLNVHYFNTTAAAVCWHNSYQIRYELLHYT